MAEKKWAALLKEAVEKCTPLPNEDVNNDIFRERQEKGLAIFNQLLKRSAIKPEEKIIVLESLYKILPSEAIEIIIAWRDAIGFLKGDALERFLDTLVLLTTSNVDPHQRSITAATLYTRGYIDRCYECFSALAADKDLPYMNRVDACKYLFASNDEDLVTESQENLFDILRDRSDPTFTSPNRYRVVAAFASKTGITSFFNSSKLRVPYDENFVYGLQHLFFNDLQNGLRERILSGQHLLKMDGEIVSSEEKLSIGQRLLDIANDLSIDENIRADAADVVLREGTLEQRMLARIALSDLGYAAVDAKSSNILDRVRTVYTNSQNVHDDALAESMVKFIEKIVSDTTISPRPYEEVHEEISQMVRSRKFDAKRRLGIFRALSRVEVDTATFTSYKVTIAEILVHVWERICMAEPEIRVTRKIV